MYMYVCMHINICISHIYEYMYICIYVYMYRCQNEIIWLRMLNKQFLDMRAGDAMAVAELDVLVAAARGLMASPVELFK